MVPRSQELQDDGLLNCKAIYIRITNLPNKRINGLSKMVDLIYKDLSYVINGIAFKIDNEIGYGFDEKIYADAFEELLKKGKLKYQREVYSPVKVDNKVIARRFIDFIIEDKIVVELKQGINKYRKVCDQLFQYLRINKLKLGIVIRFTKNGVKIKRIPNFY